MSSSDRRLFLAFLAGLPLAACGFRPAYGPGAPARALFDAVAVDAPDNKNDFDFVERIEERIGRPQQARFRLSYAISITTEALAIRRTNAITRYRLHGTVRYELRRSDGTKAIAADKVSSFTAYSASGTSIITVASKCARSEGHGSRLSSR